MGDELELERLRTLVETHVGLWQLPQTAEPISDGLATSLGAATGAPVAPVDQRALGEDHGRPPQPPEPPEVSAAAAAAAAAPRGPKGRFPAGTSGNLKGRPKRRERAFTARQGQEDWLNEMEELVPIRVNGKVVQLPYHIALIKQMKQKAITTADPKLVNLLYDKYFEAQAAYEDADAHISKLILGLEQRLIYEEDPDFRARLEEGLNHLRRLTRPSKR